ncbi:hypothetical protein [Amycolatopsis antarctica]|uniref:hypothetical protein n=1 Tax=Amycolatopsis antarctica TaxID=1854586 RepID=UPI0013FDF2DE|nr:hypothetical protein [Amycolatopsis antarctica]
MNTLDVNEPTAIDRLEQVQAVVADLYQTPGCLACGKLSFTLDALEPVNGN